MHDNACTKLKQIMHTNKKQQHTVHIYTELANKSDIRPVFLSFLTSVVLFQWRNLNSATRSTHSLLCDVTPVVYIINQSDRTGMIINSKCHCGDFNMTDPSKEINTPQQLFCYGIPASISVVNPKILIILMVLNTCISITATTGTCLFS